MTDIPALVDSDWLAARLGEPDLRVYDCTVYLSKDSSGTGQSAKSGRADWEAGHIPGSGFADLLVDLADTSLPYRSMCPAPDRLAATLGRLGIGDDSRVVLYDRDQSAWSARLWWMLRSIGFERAAVLDGGWQAWVQSGKPVSIELCTYAPARLTANPRPGVFADKKAVTDAMAEPGALLLNALRREQHLGTGGIHYGRAGRIPGSVNVPFRTKTDPATGRFKPLDDIRREFAAAGVFDADRVVAYCGAGIAASGDAFLLHLLGVNKVSVYDASLEEWATTPSLPMEAG